MPVTERDREFARDKARRIIEHKRKRGERAFINHISKNFDYEEALRRGILTECAFAHKFALVVGPEVYEYGDGGADFLLTIENRQTRVDVKTKSVRLSFEGMVRVGTHLRVEARECAADTVYVFGVYYEQTDDAEVYRWAWGRELIKRNAVMNFDATIRTADNYTMPFEELHSLEEFKQLAGLIKPRAVPQPPDLQEWVRKHGGYWKIPWDQWDEAMRQFNAAYASLPRGPGGR